jgi:hypothetical protein
MAIGESLAQSPSAFAAARRAARELLVLVHYRSEPRIETVLQALS